MARAAVVAVGLVAAIVVILVVVVLPRSGQGPLVPHIGGSMGVGQPAAVSWAISVSGPLIVENTGDHTLVLDRVELVGLASGIYRRAYVPRSQALCARRPRHTGAPATTGLV